MKVNLLRNSFRLLFGLILFASIILVESGTLHSQYNKPAVPVLSLTGMDNRWDEEWYPDGRIWIPVSNQAPREFLVPVFINNRWATYNQTKDYYKAKPIYSFEFKMFYDSSAVRVMGIQKFGPKDADLGYEPLASKFNISWDDYKNFTYMEYINKNQPDQDKRKGRQLKITATSSTPLPNTNLDADEFKVLLYVRFRVIPKVSDQALSTARNTYIYIANDTIKYNDMNVRTDAPFAELRKYKGYEFVETDYPNPTQYSGMAGVENDTNTTKGREEPYKPGAIKLRLTDIPEIGIACERGVIGTDPSIRWWSTSEAELSDPITIDTNGIDPKTQYNFGSRMIEVKNTVGTTRLLDVEIETDQPWLEVQTIRYGNSKTPCASAGRYCRIPYIDKEILGNDQIGTPIEGQLTKADPSVYVLIHCDPTKLPMNENGEFTGLYTGYITIKSHTAGISPVRLKVPFIHFRNAFEPALYDQNGRRDGIRLTLFNSRGQKGDTCALTFGVGHRATKGVDSLFGEFEWNRGFSGFGARFYPWKDPNASQNLKDFGFGDFNPNDEQTINWSRDIRDINDTLQSIIYYVKFQQDSLQYNKIILEWDVADFPDGANLFLRDTANGALFPSVDMRKATNVGGTRFSYTFADPRITTFLIEYTLPKVINYVDATGAPIIKKGWNLVSMPVKPMNPTWNVFYRNAINVPYFFSQNQYQDAPLLTPGIGYFIKYSDNVDKKFVGSYITEISEETNTVRLYPGWNTIGALSVPMNVSSIDFTNYVDKVNNITYDPPQKSYTLTHGLWGYVTDRGYQEVSELRPGLGYWIKVGSFDPKRNVQGFFKLIYRGKEISNEATSKYDVLASSTVLNIRDNAQHETSLYLSNSNFDVTNFELPPVPPTGLFDARFSNGAIVANTDASVIMLQGIDYPVSIELNNTNSVYTFVDAITGDVLAKSEGNSAVIKASKSNMVKVLKSEASALSITNYPNPVNTNSTISYTVPANELVVVKLFDAIGNEVKTLVNEVKTAGEYTIILNANELTSGSYICKITSGSNSAVRTINVIK